MKKTFFVFVSLVFVSLMFTACPPHPPLALPTPVPTMTMFPTPVGTISLMDDLEDGNNQNNSVDWGGYWYTFDDLAAPNNGVSKVWPMSQTAADKYAYPGVDPLPTFVMTAPGAGTLFCARVSGTVTVDGGFQYAFVGMGMDTLGEDPPDSGNKVAYNMNTEGWTHVYFEAKRGPKDTGTGAYKIKMVTSANGFSDSSDQRLYIFNPTSTWAQYLVPVSSFTQEGWGTPITLSDAMSAVIAFQWQTNFRPGTADLYVDNIYLVKQ